MLRRTPGVRKPLSGIQTRLEQLADRGLEDATTVLVNGIPADAQAAAGLGVLAGSPDAWLDLHRAVEDASQGRFSKRLNGRDALLREIQYGDSDVVYVMAHSDGISLYIGGDRIRLADTSRPFLLASRYLDGHGSRFWRFAIPAN